MSRKVEKDYEKIFQTKVLQLLRKLLLNYRKVTRLEGFKYLEVETVGHVALNLGLHILYTFLLILPMYNPLDRQNTNALSFYRSKMILDRPNYFG